MEKIRNIWQTVDENKFSTKISFLKEGIKMNAVCPKCGKSVLDERGDLNFKAFDSYEYTKGGKISDWELNCSCSTLLKVINDY